MDELQSILIKHHIKNKKTSINPSSGGKDSPSMAEIPDLFFDDILKRFKLTRIEIQVLMYLYRIVWCKPNLYSKYGLTPMLSYTEVSKLLEIENDELMNSIHNLEGYGFIQTMRAGQYLVHRYFLKEFDQEYGISYDEF